MYGEFILRPVPATKTGQAPSRLYRATPSVLSILAVYLVSSSGVADPSFTSEGLAISLASQTQPTPARIAFSITHAMSLPSLGSAVGLPVAHPGTGREWYYVLYSPQIQNKHLVSPARLPHGEETVWSNSHHHLVSNTPRNSWCVN